MHPEPSPFRTRLRTGEVDAKSPGHAGDGPCPHQTRDETRPTTTRRNLSDLADGNEPGDFGERVLIDVDHDDRFEPDPSFLGSEVGLEVVPMTG